MNSCFALIGAHQHGIAVGSKSGENLCLVEVSAEHSFKRQLRTTHVDTHQAKWTFVLPKSPYTSVRYELPLLRAAVCKCREFAVKTETSKFFIFSQKKPFSETFSKIRIKVSKKFSFWREPAKSEMLPHAIYSHWSKTFESYHFQSPREVACVASVPNRVIARTLEREQWKGEGEGRRGNACPQTQDAGKRPLIFHERLLRNVNGIKNLLPKLNPHKAPSPDNLHTQVLKE